MINDSLNRTQIRFEEMIGRLSLMSGEQDAVSMRKVVDSVAPDISDLRLEMSRPNQPLPLGQWTVLSDYLAVSTFCDANNISISYLSFRVNQLGRIASIVSADSKLVTTVGLPELPYLETLHLLESGSAACDQLNAVSQLKVLGLSHFKPTSFDFLKSLMNLRELAVTETGLSDLSPFASLHPLEKLTLANNGITDISPLICMRNLRELHIYRENILNVSPISQLYELTSVTLNYLPRQELSFLLWLPKLQHVSISVDMIVDDRELQVLAMLRDKGVGVAC